MHPAEPPLRALVIVLGDQLDRQSSALQGFDPACDAVWMAEVAEASTHVWSAKQHIAVFLSAMRHFSEALRRGCMRGVYWTQMPGYLTLNAPGQR